MVKWAFLTGLNYIGLFRQGNTGNNFLISAAPHVLWPAGVTYFGKHCWCQM